jgi:hypothetical protein
MNKILKTGVGSDFKGMFFDRLFKTPPESKGSWFKNQPWVWAPPQNRLTI